MNVRCGWPRCGEMCEMVIIKLKKKKTKNVFYQRREMVMEKRLMPYVGGLTLLRSNII